VQKLIPIYKVNIIILNLFMNTLWTTIIILPFNILLLLMIFLFCHLRMDNYYSKDFYIAIWILIQILKYP